MVDTELWDAPFPLEITRVSLADEDVRAFVGAVGDAVLLRVWHARGREGTLSFDANLLSDSVVVTERDHGGDPAKAIRHWVESGQLVLPVDNRDRVFDVRGMESEAVKKALTAAVFAVRPAASNLDSCGGFRSLWREYVEGFTDRA